MRWIPGAQLYDSAGRAGGGWRRALQTLPPVQGPGSQGLPHCSAPETPAFLRCQHLSSSLTLWERSHPAVHPTRPLRRQVALMPGVTFQPDDHAALPREQRGASCLHSERTTHTYLLGHFGGAQPCTSCKSHGNSPISGTHP